MDAPGPLIGRDRERVELDRAVEDARDGRGSLVLVTGEAGVGKTTLVNAVLADCALLTLVGAPASWSSEPYGPIVAVLRAFLRVAPGGLHDPGALTAHLNFLLPELGRPPAATDATTLGAAIRWAFEQIVARRPAVVFLDDLHGADEATIGLLATSSAWIEELPLLVVCAYQQDELPRDHPLRRLRLKLRRAGWARELSLEPLDQAGTAQLAARVLGHPPSPALQTLLHDRSNGLPFLVEELASALAASGRLQAAEAGLALDPHDPLPIPESVRDAFLLRSLRLSAEARVALHVAAVAGLRFSLNLVADLAGGVRGLDELLERRLLVESAPGIGAFRHALVREVVSDDIPWGRRRALHREIAEWLEARGTPPGAIAEHWSAADEPERARSALMAAAEASCAIHAYRDAARFAGRALALWPEDAVTERLELLERLAHCAELSGEPAEAVRVWRDAAEGWRSVGDLHRQATAERQLATLYEVQGAWEQALATRLSAADAFAAGGLPGEAAAERLAVASHLRTATSHTAALRLIETVYREADEAGRLDLKARALGLEGNVRARTGQYEAGLALVREGLSLAFEHHLSGPAAEVYYRLGDSLDHAGHYSQARGAYLAAADFCRARDHDALAQMCLACMTVVLWQLGEWDRTAEVCRGILASAEISAHSRTAATCLLGVVHAFRGDVTRARPLLVQAAALAHTIELTAVELFCHWTFAFLEQLGGNLDAAAGHYRALLARWERSEERHYVISPLRSASTFFATTGAAAEARACTNALSRIAADTANPEALAGLAHAVGETLLLDGDAEQAARQFERALDLLREIPVPFHAAKMHLRAGVALGMTGQRVAAVEHLTDAYRTARKLGARPLAAQATTELAALGVTPDRRRSRKGAATPEGGGLSQRQIEVLSHIAQGRTDREIAQLLFLSPRTVEMHVANCLARLNCRSRAEAIRRASTLGILAD